MAELIELFQIESSTLSFERERSNLIPLLQRLQQDIGYLSPEAIEAAAERLGLSQTEVYGVASFYAQFRFKPSGRNVIKVCRGTACHVGGGERILSELERQLKVKPGETTEDLEYTLDTVACIGACALAPVVLVNEEIHGRAATARVLGAVAAKKAGPGCGCDQ